MVRPHGDEELPLPKDISTSGSWTNGPNCMYSKPVSARSNYRRPVLFTTARCLGGSISTAIGRWFMSHQTQVFLTVTFLLSTSAAGIAAERVELRGAHLSAVLG